MNRLFKKLDHHAHEILSKGAIAFILKVVGAGLAFLLQVAIARYLGASDAGLYFLAFTIITLLATVSRLGMDNSVTRFVAAHASEGGWGEVRGVVRHALRITVVLSMMVSITVFMSSGWVATVLFNKPGLSSALQLMALAILPLAMATIYTSALQGMKRVRDVMLMQSVLPPLITLGCLFYLAPLLGLSGAVMSYGVGIVITLILGAWIWRRVSMAWQHVSPSFSVRVLFSSSIALLGALLLQQTTQALPMLLLGVWGDNEELGLFSAAQRTANLVSLILVAANSIVAPKFSELYQRNDLVTLGKVARHSALLMTGMASPALLLFLIFPEWVMSLFGDGFSEGWLLLVIMALGQIVNVMTGSVGFLLIMTGNERQFLTANLIALGISVGLAVVLIPILGVVGAAISAAIPLALVNLLRVHFVWRKLGIMVLPLPLPSRLRSIRH